MRVPIRLKLVTAFLAWWVWLALAGAAAAGMPDRLSEQPRALELTRHGRLMPAQLEDFPPDARSLAGWLATRPSVDAVNLFGGSYWLYAELRHDLATVNWVLAPYNTIIEDVQARIYGSDGSIQTVQTGYRHAGDYMMHYGKDVTLLPGVTYQVLIAFSSPYYASYPGFEIRSQANYRAHVAEENAKILTALGAILALAVFNLFLFIAARDKSQLYYAAQLIAFFAGWAFVFHLPAELLGIRNLHLHYVPFFLLPAASALFCIHFLRLRVYLPQWASASYALAWISVALLPVSFFALPYAHVLATVVIIVWMPIALISGVLCWRKGYRPARYFVLAYVALCLPALVILPANLGLVPDIVENSELLTLLGGTLDALLLAFALADRIKLLSEEKDGYLVRLNKALEQAQTDALTGIGNRYAFDEALDRRFLFGADETDEEQDVLVLIDLDGLKDINDRYGHAAGDDLLRTFAGRLAKLNRRGISCYRLGGDEFAIIARRSHVAFLHDAMASIETAFSEYGFAQAGVSYGIAYAHESPTPSALMDYADRRMYTHKASRNRGRSRTLTVVQGGAGASAAPPAS
jgi:diguanylate cyclase (GGDEF)-like protein